MESFSYLADFFVGLIRTCRKTTLAGRASSLENPLCFKAIEIITPEMFYSGTGARPNRTPWKINSYRTDFLSSKIRTSWKSIRTGRQRSVEIIQESIDFCCSIYTFLFISQEEVRNESL
jgi:hypothetical protein